MAITAITMATGNTPVTTATSIKTPVAQPQTQDLVSFGAGVKIPSPNINEGWFASPIFHWALAFASCIGFLGFANNIDIPGDKVVVKSQPKTLLAESAPKNALIDSTKKALTKEYNYVLKDSTLNMVNNTLKK